MELSVLSPQYESICSELSKILSSSCFNASIRQAKFLEYVVEETLAGRFDRLKGYTIGVAVLDKGSDFDPEADPAVRIVAGRVRQALERYYKTEGKDDQVIITLPKGGYVPNFDYVVSSKHNAYLKETSTYETSKLISDNSAVSDSKGMTAWLVDKWEPAFKYSNTPNQIEYIPLRKAKKKWNICVSFPHVKDPYWVAAAFGIESQAKALGIDVNIIEAGGYFNTEKQAQQIAFFTQRNVDALLIGAISFDKFHFLLKNIGQRIPVFSLINPIKSDLVKTQSAVDWNSMGSAIGFYLAGKYPKGLKTIKVVWLPGPAHLRWVQDSDKAFRSAIENSAIEIIATRYGDTGKAAQLELLKEILEEHHNIDCIVGYAVAIEAALDLMEQSKIHRKVKLYSDCLTPRVYQGIHDGEVVAATTDYPVLQARIALDQVVRSLENLPVHKHVGPAVFVLDRKNVSRIPVEQALAPPGFEYKGIKNNTEPGHTLRFAVFDYPPYQITSGNDFFGIDIELNREIFKRIGCDLIFEKMSESQSIKQLKSGDVDIVGTVRQVPKTSSQYYETLNLHSVLYKLFVASESEGDFSTLEEFFEAGNRIALPRGFCFGEIIGHTIKEYKDNIIRCEDVQSGLHMLVNECVEGMIIDPSVAKYYLEMLCHEDIKFSTVHASAIYLAPPSGIYIAFSKQNLPQTLVQRYEEELYLMQERGEYEEIIQMYFHSKH